MGGIDQRAHTNISVGLRAQSKEEPSSAMGRTPPRPGSAEDEGKGLPLRVTLWIIPWNGISTKTEKDNGRNGNI